MEQMQEIDMDCPTTKLCVSVMAGKLCQVGLQNHISAWNNHRIPGTLIITTENHPDSQLFMYALYGASYIASFPDLL